MKLNLFIQSGSCKYKISGDSGAKVIGKVIVSSGKGNVAAVKQALANNGPVSACFLVTGNFGGYTGGIYQEDNCAGIDEGEANHCVGLVGYGLDSTYGEYFILRNSWGPGWGQGGYMKIASNNMCNIASYVSYPLLIKSSVVTTTTQTTTTKTTTATTTTQGQV